MKNMIKIFSILYSILIFPVQAKIDYFNCNKPWTLNSTPKHVIALNQNAVDLIIELNIGSLLSGVGFIDDINPIANDGSTITYRGFPILSKYYPSIEFLQRNHIDFVIGGLHSAFHNITTAMQEPLKQNNINSYLLSSACSNTNDSISQNISSVFYDLTQLGNIFNRKQRADEIINAIKQNVIKTKALPQISNKPSIFYFDSYFYMGSGLVYKTEGKAGFITNLINIAGGTNVFEDRNLRFFNAVADDIVKANPDIILLSNSYWSPAIDKINYLENDPLLKTLPAVKNKKFIILPYSKLYPGVYCGKTVLSLAEKIRLILNS